MRVKIVVVVIVVKKVKKSLKLGVHLLEERQQKMKKQMDRQKLHKNYLKRKMKPNLKVCHLKLHLHNQRMDKALKRNN